MTMGIAPIKVLHNNNIHTGVWDTDSESAQHFGLGKTLTKINVNVSGAPGGAGV